jgi:replicative DNA helicase
VSPLEIPARIPPHNLDAERAVLGAMLLEGRDGLPRVIEILRPSDFYTEAHRAMFDTMLRLFDRGEPVDLITLSEEMRRTDQLEFVGGPAALALLVEQASIAAHLMSYASIVRDMAVLRELIQTSTQIITQAFDAKEEVQTVVDDAERRIFSLAERRLEGSALPVSRILKDTFEHIERLYERKEHVTGVATGFEKLDLETSGFQPSDFIIIAARPSMGKAQPLDARVKTPTGWARMGDLSVGDPVASVDGVLPSVVTGVFPQGERQVYRVTFRDGRSAECTEDHLWRVHNRAWSSPRVLATGRLQSMLTQKRYQGRLWIDTPSGEWGAEQRLPVDPWVLGVLIGEGNLTNITPRVSMRDDEILDRLRTRLAPHLELRPAGGVDWRLAQVGGACRKGRQGAHENPLTRSLREVGLWGLHSPEKFIPPVYLDAPREDRMELLRGLMDTDGWVEKVGTVQYVTTSERLAADVTKLVRSVGGQCRMTSRMPAYSYRGEQRAGRRAFLCSITHTDLKSFFSLERKRARVIGAPTRRRLTVTSIEAVRRAPTQCITVSHPSQLYITDDHVVTHNTAFALNIAQYVGVHLRQKVLVMSLEMSAQQLVQRMLCSEAKVDSQAVRTGYLTSADWHRLTAAAGRLAEAPVFIDDSPGLTVLEARAKARRLKAEHGLDLVIIDYLQLMRGRSGQENRQQEISEISRSLKALAKELHVPVVALSQLSRAVEARSHRDFRPQLSDLRESGALEQDADLILFIYRQKVYKDDVAPDEEKVAEIIIGKQRNGPIGTVKLIFLPEYARFENAADLHRQPSPF